MALFWDDAAALLWRGGASLSASGRGSSDETRLMTKVLGAFILSGARSPDLAYCSQHDQTPRCHAAQRLAPLVLVRESSSERAKEGWRGGVERGMLMKLPPDRRSSCASTWTGFFFRAEIWEEKKRQYPQLNFVVLLSSHSPPRPSFTPCVLRQTEFEVSISTHSIFPSPARMRGSPDSAPAFFWCCGTKSSPAEGC